MEMSLQKKLRTYITQRKKKLYGRNYSNKVQRIKRTMSLPELASEGKQGNIHFKRKLNKYVYS